MEALRQGHTLNMPIKCSTSWLSDYDWSVDWIDGLLVYGFIEFTYRIIPHRIVPIFYLGQWCNTRLPLCSWCPGFGICCQRLRKFLRERKSNFCSGVCEDSRNSTVDMSDQIALRSDTRHTHARPLSIYNPYLRRCRSFICTPAEVCTLRNNDLLTTIKWVWKCTICYLDRYS